MRSSVIYRNVVSPGCMNGPRWVKQLDERGIPIGECVREKLCLSLELSQETTKRLAILGDGIFKKEDLTIKNIFAEAKRRRFANTHIMTAPLVCDKFSSRKVEAMGLWGLVVVHEPFRDEDGNLVFFGFAQGINGIYCLNSFHVRPNTRWVDGLGFIVERRYSPG